MNTETAFRNIAEGEQFRWMNCTYTKIPRDNLPNYGHVNMVGPSFYPEDRGFRHLADDDVVERIDADCTTQRRVAYFLMETVKTPQGAYIPCIAIEGEAGYHRTDWNYGTNRLEATAAINTLNARLGLTVREAAVIQISTMKSIRRN